MSSIMKNVLKHHSKKIFETRYKKILDSTQRKASEICLRPPLDIYSHTFSRNPTYDQYQPKDHYDEENPQSMTKMPGNPKFYQFH